jgi:hypothetical protein
MRLSLVMTLAAVFAVLCGVSYYADAGDSVPALAKALSQLPPDRTILDVPEGVYTIASPWIIRREGVTIRGAGIGKTVLVRDPRFNDIMVHIGANSTITGLTLDGNGTARVIFLDRPGAVADTIEVKNFTQIGIGVPALASACRISKCLIGGPGTPSAGIWHDAGPTSSDSTIMIDHNTVTNSGIYCTGGKVSIVDNQLSGNHCEKVGGGGQIDVGNAFTRNTVGTITGNTIVNGGGPQAGGIEAGGGYFTITNNIIRNHGLAGIGVGHNVIGAKIVDNVVSDSGQYVADRNRPQCRSAIYVGYGATNVEISANQCFDDQPNKTQTWGIILVGVPARPDPRFSPNALEHVVIRGNDLRGNLHREGLLDESGARDRNVSSNLR